ncbi:glycosyltransferase family 25 protein, partial [Dissoconium aciculare CBS 342.82]|uniref:Glycosyltransferase family 25 protein n=1 Tax=Dissoconium aciculare CBS 342.82 TaxID=1314786 RepID=A0A6J3M0G0_9PEZI
GARKLLHEIGSKSLTTAYDLTLRTICDGIEDRHPGTCLTVQLPRISSFQPAGSRAAQSDIGDLEGYVDWAFTGNIRLSTRVNFAKLVHGATDYIDSFPEVEQRRSLE